MKIQVLYGDDVFHRDRALKAHLAKYVKVTGGEVCRLSLREVEGDLGSRGVFFSDERVLYLVTSLVADDLKVLERLAGREGRLGELWLVLEGGLPKGKLGKFLEGLKDKVAFELPAAEWKRVEAAKAFCLTEAASLGVSFQSELLVDSLVERLGPDYGLLAFEMLKLSLLGVPKVTAEHLRATVPAFLGGGEVLGLHQAILRRDVRIVSKALQRVRVASKDDPTIAVCFQLWGLLKGLLEVVALRDSGIPPEMIAESTGKNLWFLQNKLLPSLRAWKLTELFGLIEVLSKSSTLQRSGGLAPWQFFCAEVLRLL